MLRRYDASDGSIFIAGNATPPTALGSHGASLYFADPDDPGAFVSQSGFALADITVVDRMNIRDELLSGENFGFSEYDGTEDEFLDFLIPFP